MCMHVYTHTDTHRYTQTQSKSEMSHPLVHFLNITNITHELGQIQEQSGSPIWVVGTQMLHPCPSACKGEH